MPRRKVTIAEPEPKPAKAKATKKDKTSATKSTKAKSDEVQANKKVKLDYEQKLVNDFSHDAKNLIQIVLGLQKNSSNTTKAVNDLKKIYDKIDHAKFFEIFRKLILAFLILPESQSDNANKMLKFLGSFVASYGEVTLPDGDTHPLITKTFDEILEMTSKVIHVRARICMFIAHIMTSFSGKAEIDEIIFDNIAARINSTFVRDPSPLVRQNAILALQRLQNPDDKEDPVTKVYQFHLECDPVAKVRMTVITAIAKKLNMISMMIDRLQDIDEKVRRHVYLQMSSFPVKTYRIIDRIAFLEAGLNDRSEKVTEAVANVLLPNWISAYERNYAELIKAIKMDSNDKELTSFRDLAEKTLEVLFKKQPISDLIEYLQVSSESELPRCIPIEKSSSLEWLLIWKVVIKTFQKNSAIHADEERTSDASDHEADEPKVDQNIVPELSVLCNFIEKFAKDFKSDTENDAKYQNLLFNQSLIVLFEIVELCDLSDEVGCGKIREIVKEVLTKNALIESTIKKLVEVVQAIETNPEVSLNYFNDIIIEMVGAGASEYSRQSSIEALISKADMQVQVKANQLKHDMMDLKEKELRFVDKKEYGKAQSVKEEFDKLELQLHELLKPIVEASDENSDASKTLMRTLSATTKKLSGTDTLKNLRICFYSLMGKGIKTINHRTLDIYNNFIRYHLESNDVHIRLCAITSAIACSMLYESLAKEVLELLKMQIFKCTTIAIWEIAINGITDLILRYGMTKLEVLDGANGEMSQNRSKRGGRTLYNNDDEDEEETELERRIGVILIITHLLDTEADKSIQRACHIAFSKLILHGQYSTRELVSKFLISYFNPATDSEINQILGIFFGAIAVRKKQDCLSDALIPTLKTLIDSPYDSPLREVKIETVIKFVVNLTRPVYCSNGLNLHNVLSMKLLEFITENIEDREVTRVIPKELMTLEIGDDPLLRKDLIAKIATLIENTALDVKSGKLMKDLKNMLEGTYRAPIPFSSTGGQSVVQPTGEGGEEENDDDAISDGEAPEKPAEDKQTDKEKEISIAETKNESSLAVELNATTEGSPNASKLAEKSQTSQNSTLIDETEMDEDATTPETPEEAPEVPKTPANPVSTRRSIAKRQIYTPKTFESPQHKKINVTAGTSFSDKTMLTPKTPNFTLPNSKVSTPNTERQTRSRARAEEVLNTKVTRSQSLNASSSAKKGNKTEDDRRLSRSQTKK